MSPEMLYQICLNRALRFAHDHQSAEAAANGATANIWLIPNKPADAHIDERIWRYWARFYTREAYERENMLRDQRLVVEECEFENDLAPVWEREPDASYLEMIAESTNPRAIEAHIEGKETEQELLSLMAGVVTPTQGRIMMMFIQGFTVKEIAETLGTGCKYIYDAATAARRRIREANPDVPETYAEYLMKKAPIHYYRRKYKHVGRPDSNLERRLRTGEASLAGRVQSTRL
jgi:DNA-directed RNA polymerase specialized sigma24 family protein